MDQGLFTKHIKNILERDALKQKVMLLLLETTGIELDDSEITLSKKNVSISTSSVKRSILLKKGLKDILQSNGFNLIS